MPRATRSRNYRVLCLCGAPAVGKSTAAALLNTTSDFAVIESGEVVAQLLGSQVVHELSAREQDRFRRNAIALVCGDGTTPLVRSLRRRIRAADAPVILVGVRNPSTIDGLRRTRTFDVRVAFLNAPLRVRAKRYNVREGKRALAYSTVLKAQTETEHVAVMQMADERIDASQGLRALKRALAPAARWLRAT